MPIKMYDLMWKELCAICSQHYKFLTKIIYTIEQRHTYISQPEAIKLFKTSKKTLAHLRDDWGMPYVSVGVGSSEQFFYKEEEVRTHLEELRGKK